MYRLGYTAGVFDLFHVGHLQLIKRAKEQCEHLIVAVSTDELVMEYKHKKPVIPFDERVEIVRAIRYADEVVPQYNRNKREALTRFGFDAMFVGDDWKGSALFTQLEKEFNNLGVDIVYLPYTHGTSSTLLTQVLTDIIQKDHALV
jgi:glycerol-3-phosphate cytidylyltransferase